MFFLAASACSFYALPLFPSPLPLTRGQLVQLSPVFKSSVPEFIEIRIQENSAAATYEIRQLDEDAGATPFEVGPALRSKFFS